MMLMWCVVVVVCFGGMVVVVGSVVENQRHQSILTKIYQKKHAN